MEFYNRRRGILVRYSIEARLPGAAVVLGHAAALADYPPTPRRRRLGLFQRAERTGGKRAGGWDLYRIVQDPGQPRTR